MIAAQAFYGQAVMVLLWPGCGQMAFFYAFRSALHVPSLIPYASCQMLQPLKKQRSNFTCSIVYHFSVSWSDQLLGQPGLVQEEELLDFLDRHEPGRRFLFSWFGSEFSAPEERPHHQLEYLIAYTRCPGPQPAPQHLPCSIPIPSSFPEILGMPFQSRSCYMT